VGDLTLRQFLYVGIGGRSPTSFYCLKVIDGYLRFPAMFLFGAGGVAFAFIPIKDLTLDVWLINYLKDVYRPERRLMV